MRDKQIKFGHDCKEQMILELRQAGGRIKAQYAVWFDAQLLKETLSENYTQTILGIIVKYSFAEV